MAWAAAGHGAQNPQLVQAVLSLLSNDGAHGGLAGLVERFQQAGLGNVLQSWIGTGANLPISGEQLASVLGQGTLSQLGSQVGAAPADVAQQLSQLLPGLVDRLTPQGQMPQGGLGNSSDLMGVLGQFFSRLERLTKLFWRRCRVLSYYAYCLRRGA